MLTQALVTGSSGLIGSEVCRTFLAQGMRVYGLDLKANKSLKHPEFHHLKCDVSDEASVKAALSSIKSLDILVNNAAQADPHNAPLEKLALKDWNKILGINLTSVFLVSKYAIPKLRKSQGSIINIASTRHLMAEAHTEIYCTTKGGIISLTRSMAISLGPEIRVNSISPGWIAAEGSELKASDHHQHPVGRVGRPQDVAELALYLGSMQSGFVTGQDFVIDGGMTVKMIYQD
jgi:NAD(P)-dependent dehydrogenase (short-subunit alcohol dehydrogenase family)